MSTPPPTSQDTQHPSYHSAPTQTIDPFVLSSAIPFDAASQLPYNPPGLQAHPIGFGWPLRDYQSCMERYIKGIQIFLELHQRKAIRSLDLQQICEKFVAKFQPCWCSNPQFAAECIEYVNKSILETCSTDKTLVNCMRCKKRCLTEITCEIKIDEETRFVCFICIRDDFVDLNELEDDYFTPNPFLQIALQEMQRILISCGYCNTEKYIREYSNLSCSLHNPVCCECLLSNCKIVCPVKSCQRPFTPVEKKKFRAAAIQNCVGCSSFKRIQDFNDCARHCFCRECQLKDFQDQANRFSLIEYVCKICSERLVKELYPVNHPAPLPIPKLVEEEKTS
jgi:hypothetical protein